MKIAVSSSNGMVFGHFGHCPEFMIFESDGNTILASETVENPGHKPGFLPNFLNELGVNVIISGGMGARAISIFNENNIEVVTGASGDAKEVVEVYLKGELVSDGSICEHHEHKDECH